MANRAEIQRQQVVESKSPLAGHSLSRKNMRIQLEGCVRVFGRGADRRRGEYERDLKRQERKQALYDATNNLLNKNASEDDVVRFLLLADEFEVNDMFEPNANILDFKGLKTTDKK